MDLEIYEPLVITNSLNNVKAEDLEILHHSEYGEESDEFLEFKLDEDLLNLKKQKQDLTDVKDNKATLKKLQKQIQDLTDLKNNKTTSKKFKYQMQDLTDLKDNKTTLKRLKKPTQDSTNFKNNKTTTTSKKLKKQTKDLTNFKNNKTTTTSKKLKKQTKDLTDLKHYKTPLKNIKKRMQELKDLKYNETTIKKYNRKKYLRSLKKVEKKTESPSHISTVIQNKAGRELRVLVERLKFTKDGKVMRPDRIKLLTKPKVSDLPPKRENYSCNLKRVEIKSSGKKAKFGKTKKGNPQLHLNGYIYNRKAEGLKGTVYWKCTTLRCRSWVKQNGKRFVAPTKHELCAPFDYKKPKAPVKKVVHYCSFCDKSFPRKSTWIVHERTHTGEKPFVCEICNDRYATAGTLITHRLTHNSEKPYQCHKCIYGSTTSTNLKQHFWRHHVDKGPKYWNCKEYAKR